MPANRRSDFAVEVGQVSRRFRTVADDFIDVELRAPFSASYLCPLTQLLTETETETFRVVLYLTRYESLVASIERRKNQVGRSRITSTGQTMVGDSAQKVQDAKPTTTSSILRNIRSAEN